MSRSIDISETHKEIVQSILREHLANSCHVWVFGSRATWLAKEYSDLDLAIARKDGSALPLTVMSALETAFEDSLLPWKVDVIDLNGVSAEFRAAIERDKVLFSFLVNRDTSLYIEKPLAELIHIYDTMRKPVKKSDRTPGIFPYYGASGITDYVESFIFNGKFVLLAEDGDNLRTKNTPIAFIANDKFWVNNHAHVIQGNELADTAFICYALQIANIESYISGSTRPKITQADMKKIPIFCPPLPEQKAIAHILGTLDDKIELNRQTNQTLEAMAQALFQSWFVDFDPVIDKALAAGNEIPEAFQAKAAARQALGDQRQALPEEVTALFPDAFVFTEEMGWIPEGWGIEKFSKNIEFKNGYAFKSEKLVNQETMASPVFKMGNIHRGGGFKSEGTKSYYPQNMISKKIEPFFLKKGDLLMAMTDMKSNMAILGNTALMPIDNIYLLNQRVGRLRIINPKKINYPYLYLYTNYPVVVEELRSRSNSGVQVNLTAKAITDTLLLIPNREVHGLFDSQVRSYLNKIFELDKNSKTLSFMRDTLLPKLISGEMRIADVGGFLGEALT